MGEDYFWISWKNKTKQEIKYIKALELALAWLKKQPFIKNIEAVYVKGSFVERELGKKSDIDVVPIMKNKESLNLVREIRDKNKEWLKPVEILPIAIQELRTNERFKKPLPGNPQGKPDHFTVLLPYHKLVYGNPIKTKGWKVRSEEEIYNSLKKVIREQFIPLYEKGEFGFSQLIKQVSHLVYWEERLKGKIFAPSWREIKKSNKDNNLLQNTVFLCFHPTKNKKARSKYVGELKEYLKE